MKQTKFTSVEDYNKNLKFIIPENFNFAYDVMDAWAEEAPEKLAILWTNDQGKEIRTTYGELKEQTDQAASYLQSLGIGKNDPVMLILKRHYEWWVIMLALCKIGAIVIPATHMLTKHDYVYRNQRVSVKAIICADDDYIISQIKLAMPESPTVKQYITLRDEEGFHNWKTEWQQGAVVSSPAPRSTPEARAIERAFAREIIERLCREGVARLCRSERASGSERVCCSMMCGVLVLIIKRCNRTRTIRLHLVFAIHRGYNLTIVVQSPGLLLEMFCFDTFLSML